MGHDKNRSWKLDREGSSYRAQGVEAAGRTANHDHIAAWQSFGRIGCHIQSLRIPSSLTVANSSGGLGLRYKRSLDSSVPSFARDAKLAGFASARPKRPNFVGMPGYRGRCPRDWNGL
jgi:hypothetical protein